MTKTMNATMHVFGNKESLELGISKIDENGCKLSLWVNNEAFWAEENLDPIDFSPISFFYHLAIYWNHIFHDQPFDQYEDIVFSQNGPEQHIAELLRRCKEEDSLAAEIREEELLIFDRIHNIALWNDESSLPSIYIFKYKNYIYFFYDDIKCCFELSKIMKTFKNFGDFVFKEIKSLDPKNHSLAAWLNRDTVNSGK